MAPSSKLAALFFAFAIVAATLVPAAEARVQGFNQEAASEPAIAEESKVAGLPFPLFPFLIFPFLGQPGGGGGAPPSAGSGSGFRFPIPAPGSSGGAPPSSGSGFQFPFPLPFPLPHPSSPGGAPPSSGSRFPFPLPFPFPFQHRSLPGSPPSQPSPASPSSPSPSAPPPPPEQPKECITPLMSMMPCADYLTNSTAQTPPATCCDGFKSIVNAAPICLCHGINGDLNKFIPLPVDMMKMMTLPNTCGATVPLQTFSMCNSPAVPPLMPAPAPSSPPSP